MTSPEAATPSAPTGPDPERITIETNRMRFAALAWGDPGAPLTICLHGYPDTAWSWRIVGPLLASAGRRVVAPFSRGYAPTGPAPSDRYMISDLADDAVAINAALGGADSRDSALIGHDWGAVTAHRVLDANPEAFGSVVILSIPPTTGVRDLLLRPRDARLTLNAYRRSLYQLFNQLPWLPERIHPRLAAYLWRSWSPGFDAAASGDLERLEAALPDQAHRRAAVRYYRNNLGPGLLKTFSIQARAPYLLLHGTDDGCYSSEVSEAYRDHLFPGSRLELIEGAGHWLQLEAPERVAREALTWIESGAAAH